MTLYVLNRLAFPTANNYLYFPKSFKFEVAASSRILKFLYDSRIFRGKLAAFTSVSLSLKHFPDYIMCRRRQLRGSLLEGEIKKSQSGEALILFNTIY